MASCKPIPKETADREGVEVLMLRRIFGVTAGTPRDPNR